jgi:hypothetical protein
VERVRPVPLGEPIHARCSPCGALRGANFCAFRNMYTHCTLCTLYTILPLFQCEDSPNHTVIEPLAPDFLYHSEAMQNILSQSNDWPNRE